MEALRPGDVIRGRYRVERQLGRGAHGTTLQALELATGRQVAVKALALAHLDDWKVVELFEREARALEHLDHPRIPEYIDDLGPDPEGGDHRFYLVQALAPGRPLDALLAEGWRPGVEELVAIAEQLLEVLVYLHQLNPPVVHRDIKPGNILVERDAAGAPSLYLVDFGSVTDAWRGTLTHGTVVGTFGYMAPEQMQGRATAAADLYGVGATLVHLATGVPPSDLPQKRLRLDFRGKTTLPLRLVRWLERLVEPAVEDRFAAATEALASLRSPAEPAEGSPADLPAGTQLRVERSPTSLRVEIPPAGLAAALPSAGFAVFWLGVVAFWTSSALSMGGSGFFGSVFPLFSIPFWAVGLYQLYRAARAGFGRERLNLDRDEGWSLERTIGPVRLPKKRGELAALGGAVTHDRKNESGRAGQRVVRLETITGAVTIEGRLSEMERSWLIATVNAHLERWR